MSSDIQEGDYVMITEGDLKGQIFKVVSWNDTQGMAKLDNGGLLHVSEIIKVKNPSSIVDVEKMSVVELEKVLFYKKKALEHPVLTKQVYGMKELAEKLDDYNCTIYIDNNGYIWYKTNIMFKDKYGNNKLGRRSICYPPKKPDSEYNPETVYMSKPDFP